MSNQKLTLGSIPESDLSKALFSVSALVAKEVIQKAKQYNTLILIMDEHGNIQRVRPESFETPSQ